MKVLITIAAIAGLATGIRAALLWFNASKVTIDPICIPSSAIGATISISAATVDSYQESSALNARAAGWTALSVVFNVGASFLSVLNG